MFLKAVYLQGKERLIRELLAPKRKYDAVLSEGYKADNALPFLAFHDDSEFLSARLVFERQNDWGIESIIHLF